MLKLFATLYLAVILTFIALVLSVAFLPNLIIAPAEPLVDKISLKLSASTLALFEEVAADNEQATLQRYADKFPERLGISPLDEFELTPKQLTKLQAGKVLNYLGNTKGGEEPPELFIKWNNKQQILWLQQDMEVNMDNLEITVSGGQFIPLTFALLDEYLSEIPVQQWSLVLDHWQQRFGTPLQIVSDLSEAEYQRLREGEVFDRTHGSDRVTFVGLIKGQALQLGSISIPKALLYMPYILLLIVAFVFAAGLLLWLWPLWSQLKNLSAVAQDFGNGYYNARINYRKTSGLATISSAFNHMAERIEQQLRTQRELNAAISHELRTPLSRIRFSIERINHSDNKTEISEQSDNINHDIDELDALLEDLLTYARIDSSPQTVTFQAIRMQTWLQELHSSLQRLQPCNKQLHWQVPMDDGDIQINVLLLNRAVQNIVQNAFRYARQQVHVKIGLEYDQYTIHIEDDGKGIPTEQQTKLFDAFSRLDESRNRSSGGFGLGLAIAKRSIDAHQGSINVSASDLGGAQFIIQCPRK